MAVSGPAMRGMGLLTFQAPTRFLAALALTAALGIALLADVAGGAPAEQDKTGSIDKAATKDKPGATKDKQAAAKDKGAASKDKSASKDKTATKDKTASKGKDKTKSAKAKTSDKNAKAKGA